MHFLRLTKRHVTALALCCVGPLFSTTVARAQLIVERNQGGPMQFNGQLAPVAAHFTLSEGTRITGIKGWWNGSGHASVGITNDAFALGLGAGFDLQPVFDAPAKWQGVSPLFFDLQPGGYWVILQGGELPFAYGGPPSTAPQQPSDYMVFTNGHWEEGFPFGVRVYGVPLSAVPEPTTYATAAALLLLGTIIWRRKRRIAPIAVLLVLASMAVVSLSASSSRYVTVVSICV